MNFPYLDQSWMELIYLKFGIFIQLLESKVFYKVCIKEKNPVPHNRKEMAPQLTKDEIKELKILFLTIEKIWHHN